MNYVMNYIIVRVRAVSYNVLYKVHLHKVWVRVSLCLQRSVSNVEIALFIDPHTASLFSHFGDTQAVDHKTGRL